MDETDHELIRLLRADARTPVAELARRLGVSRGTVQNRINRLVGQGAILGFTLRQPPRDATLRVRAIMSIAVEGRRSNEVAAALRGVAEAEAVHATNGRWDLVAELNSESLAAFNRALDRIRQIPGVTASETSILLETLRL